MKNNIPLLRFPEFADCGEWEEKEIIETCSYVDYRGKTPIKTSSGVFLVTAKNIKMGYIDYTSSQEYISVDDYTEVMSRGLPEVGDVLITTEAPCGNIAQVDRSNIALAQRIIKYRGKSQIINNTFLKYTFLSKTFQNELEKKVSGGIVKGIKGSILHRMSITYPELPEQQKIADCLSSLDTLINAQSEKVENLKAYKKGLLQKLFPHEGQSVPEFRFPEFRDCGEWEEKKIIDVCSYVDYRGKTPTKTSKGVFLVTAKNIKMGYIDYIISQEYISPNDYSEVMSRGLPEVGDVLITTEAPCGNIAQVDRTDIALAQRIIKYRGNNGVINNTFLKYTFLSELFQNILDKNISGGIVKGIKGSVLHNMLIQYPTLPEQQKIADCLSSLDELIDKHSQKLELLKAHKKGLMQGLFPK